MHNRLSSHSGTSAVGENLAIALRTKTTLPQGVDKRGTSQDVYYPFRPTISWFESSVAANISLNGEAPVPLKEDLSTGLFILTMDEGMVNVKTFEIDTIVDYQCTFLY